MQPARMRHLLSGKRHERREAEVSEILKQKVDVEKYGELADYDPVLKVALPALSVRSFRCVS
jgi:hypothetical protein